MPTEIRQPLPTWITVLEHQNRLLRREVLIWQVLASFGLGYMVCDILRWTGWL